MAYMSFDTVDTLLNISRHTDVGRQGMSRDIRGWLKSRMASIDDRLSQLKARLLRGEQANAK